MSNLTLLIIRHGEKQAEKPGDPDLGAGVDPKGAADDKSLVVRGWQRAGTWAALFALGAFGPDYPSPDLIYAANPNAVGDPSISRRPAETIEPLSARLQITPKLNFGVGDEGALVAEVSALTGTVLIAWEHKKIGRAILPLLTQGQNIPHLPARWDRTRFDVVLRFDRAAPGAPWSFRQLFPRLLGGDSDAPLGAGED